MASSGRRHAGQSYDAIPDFGTLYDNVPAYRERADVEFYVAEAKRGGPVLELGCGTGRILLPVAAAGCEVAGVDASEKMLERCRAKLADAGLSASLHHADIREFELGRTFSTILAPFRVVQHLLTIEDQLQCFTRVARHLSPGGRFVFDVFNPHFDKMVAADGREHLDTPEIQMPDGRTLRRTFRVKRVRWLEQVNDVELIYYIGALGQQEEKYVHDFEMRWYLRAELEHLVARAGLRIVSLYGDVDRAPLVDGSNEIVCIAEKAS
jgi:SAM-dependent methyltransferase